MFGNLRVYIDAKATMHVLLCSEHLSEPALVLLHCLYLVRKDHLCVYNKRKIHHDEFTKDSRECRIGEVFQSNPGIEESPDLEVIVEFVLDVHVRHLASGTHVPG